MDLTSDNNKNETGLNFQTLSLELQDAIKNIIKKEKYTKYDVEVKTFNSCGNNIFGKLYEIDIIGETAESKRQNTNIFLKQSIEIDKIKTFRVTDYYSKEYFFYTDLSKIFTSLQDQANIPQNDRYKVAKSYEETNDKAIILENLSKKGFKMLAKRKNITIKFAELAVQQLAKFHALAFVVEHKMPEYYNQKIKVLRCPFRFDEDWEGLIRNICTHAANLYDGDVKQKIENFFQVFITKFPKYYNDQTNVKCTLTHGDYKKNNLLVRVENGEPVEILPVDYQFIDYGCPVRDLFFLIFSGSDQEFRRKHTNDLKELYFGTLLRFLKYFDMDVETVYPIMEFERVYTEWLDYGLMMPLFATIVTLAPDTGVDMKDMTLKEMPYCPDKEYDYIFRELIDDFIEWGYL